MVMLKASLVLLALSALIMNLDGKGLAGEQNQILLAVAGGFHLLASIAYCWRQPVGIALALALGAVIFTVTYYLWVAAVALLFFTFMRGHTLKEPYYYHDDRG